MAGFANIPWYPLLSHKNAFMILEKADRILVGPQGALVVVLDGGSPILFRIL